MCPLQSNEPPVRGVLPSRNSPDVPVSRAQGRQCTGAGGVSERDRSPLCEKGVQVQSPPSYLKETFTLARYALTFPSSSWRSSSATSAIRRSRNDALALATAALAAFSHDSPLVPTSSMTLYTLSAMTSSSLLDVALDTTPT